MKGPKPKYKIELLEDEIVELGQIVSARQVAPNQSDVYSHRAGRL